MSIKGWLVDLDNHAYSTPPCCASCMGPREIEIKARVSEKNGNMRTTLTMGFPYCQSCARRAAMERLRQIVVPLLAALLAIGLVLIAWFLPLEIDPVVRFGAAIVLAMGISFVIGLVLRQSLPSPPATARGEAIILRNTSGTVLCTNEQFAWHLAQANGRQPRPGSMFMTTEIVSGMTAGVIGLLVALTWIKYGAPERTSSPLPPPQPVGALQAPANNPGAQPPQPGQRPAMPRSPTNSSPSRGH